MSSLWAGSDLVGWALYSSRAFSLFFLLFSFLFPFILLIIEGKCRHGNCDCIPMNGMLHYIGKDQLGSKRKYPI